MIRLSLRPFFHVDRYQNVAVLDFVGAEDMMEVVICCQLDLYYLQSSRQIVTTNTRIFMDRMAPFLLSNQQCWSTEGKVACTVVKYGKGKGIYQSLEVAQLMLIDDSSAVCLPPGCHQIILLGYGDNGCEKLARHFDAAAIWRRESNRCELDSDTVPLCRHV